MTPPNPITDRERELFAEIERLRESLQKIANLPYWNKPVIRGKREVGWRAHCIAVTALGGTVGKRRTVNEQKAPDSLLYKSPPEAESLRQWVGEQTTRETEQK